MEYCSSKMIIYLILISITLLGIGECLPQHYKVPTLDISTPEEVNSLEREQPISRSIKTNTIDDTVKEVEDIIRTNPALPRLTRGEILDLLENITVSDLQKTKARDPKAIMVVMPYTPKDNKNMEDLYTKAPVTHIIGGEPFKKEENISNKPKHSRRRPPVKFNESDREPVKKTPPNEEKKKYSAIIEQKDKPAVSTRNQIRRRRPATTTTTTTEPSTTTTTIRPSYATTFHPKTRRPIRRRPSTTLQPIYGIRVIDAPKLNPSSSEEDLSVEEDTKEDMVVAPSKPLSEEIQLPNHLKNLMKDLNVETALNPPKASLEEQNRIKAMLASIGALPDTTTTTTTTLMPDAGPVAEVLSPDMRDLLMSFGLLPDSKSTTIKPDPGKYYPEKAEVKPESYVGFKPLPDDGPSRDDMDALLASFGLGRSARRGKAMPNKDKNEQGYSIDMIPDNMKGIVENFGLPISREEKKLKDETSSKNIFNPDHQYASKEELQKLEKLMEMIRVLEKNNGSATEDDLKQIDMESLKELLTSLNNHNDSIVTLDQIENSPDPNNFDPGLSKNEVKRQESTTTTTAESATPSIKDLEESFGGQTETSTEAIPETTTHIHTGFYQLVDWNTFLDIDDTKGKRVNLRFQPKIGDPKRFYSVSVP